MDLLTPDKIKNDKKEEVNISQRHSAAAAVEESRIVRSLNLTRDSAEGEKERVALDLKMFEAQAEDRKAVIRGEIEGMEHRRDAAMEPVKRREEAVAQREAAIAVKEEDHEKAKNGFQERERTVTAREEALPSREAAVEAREAKIAPREAEQDEREGRIRSSVEALRLAQEVHAKKVAEDDARISAAEAKNSADAAVNATERARLNKTAVEQAKKDIEIADRYAQLTRSADEVRRMQNKKP